MRTEFTLLGQRLDLAPRRNRRRLVAAIYAMFMAGLVWRWVYSPNGEGADFFIVIFTFLVGEVLGGYINRSKGLFGDAGILEPFDGSEVLTYPKRSRRSYFASLLHPEVDKTPGFNADERFFRKRDAAHFGAYRILGNLVSLALLLDLMGGASHLLPISPSVTQKVIRLLLQIGFLFASILPQTILLWGEPDIPKLDPPTS